MMGYHGMVLVPSGRMTVPTCLCGWIGAGEFGASFAPARLTWEGHVELEERLAKIGPVDIFSEEEAT